MILSKNGLTLTPRFLVLMITKILEKLTGKDDLERVAYKEDLALLNAYLKKRPVFIPQRPKRFLDAASFTY